MKPMIQALISCILLLTNQPIIMQLTQFQSVETKEEPLIELLNLLGFKSWPNEKDILGYTFS